MRAAYARTWSWLESRPLRGLAAALVLAALLRLPLLWSPLGHDEGGSLYVASQWLDGGSSLYGDQWVDRPPALYLVYLLAEALGGGHVATRLVGLVLALVLVAAAWNAGRVLGGDAGAVLGGLVAAAIGSSYALLAHGLVEEGIAATLVMASCALTLHARYRVRGTGPQVALAYAAGFLAAGAFLVKQSHVEAAIFAFVVLAAHLREVRAMVVAGAAGIATPIAATFLWAASAHGPGVAPLWQATVAFRARALEVLGETTRSGASERFLVFLLLMVVSGVAALVLLAVTEIADRRPPHSQVAAVLAVLGYGFLSIALGGSWWVHYLVQLVPALAMVAALVARRGHGRKTVTFAAVSAVVALGVGLVMQLTGGGSDARDERLAGWLGEAARPGDTAVLAYGSPHVLYLAGLETPYPYSWSLPVRVHDPELERLVALLRSDQAPVWLVEVGDFDWWRLDAPAFTRVRADRYERVAEVCGRGVYLLEGEERVLPPRPACR